MSWRLPGSVSDLESDVSEQVIQENSRISAFAIGLNVFERKCPPKKIHCENLEIKTAFSAFRDELFIKAALLIIPKYKLKTGPVKRGFDFTKNGNP